MTRLGFALTLKYAGIEGKFPRYGEQVPPAAVEFTAELGEGRSGRVRQVFVRQPHGGVSAGTDPEGPGIAAGQR